MSIGIVEGVIKKHFNIYLVVTVDDEKDFKSSNECWICGGLFVEGDNKARDYDHVTGKYRGSAHKNCIINLRLTSQT